jgi:peptide/nickel transport system substrate-binding protein
MSQLKTKNHLLSLLTLIVLSAMILTSCGAPATETTVTTEAPPATEAPVVTEAPTQPPPPTAIVVPTTVPTQPPAADTTLTIAVSGDIAGWDPLTVIYWLANEVIVNTHDTLVTFPVGTDAAGNPVRDISQIQGLAAESFENEGNKIFTFHLRKNAGFRNGDPVTAQAVKDNFVRGLNDPTTFTSWLLTEQAQIKSADQIEVLDDYTLRVTLPQPNIMFLKVLTEVNIAIVNVNEVNQHGATMEEQMKWVAANTTGSGAYYVDSYEAGNQLTLKANPHWWGGAPYYDTVIYKVIPDAENRLLLLQNGDVDMVYEIPLKDYASLKENPNVQAYAIPTLGTLFYWTGSQVDPWTNPTLREALAYAVPYDTIINDVYYGLATRAMSWMPPLPGQVEVVPYTYDLEKAKSLLAEAGYPGGAGLPPISFKAKQGVPEEEEAAVYIQASLAEIGVTMNIETMALAAHSEMQANHTPGMFAFNFWIPYVPDPVYSLFWTFYTGASGCCNYASYSNPEVDSLLDAAAIEPDLETRNADVEQVQRIIATNPPSIPLVHPTWNTAMRAAIQGYSYYPDTLLRFADMSEKP